MPTADDYDEKNWEDDVVSGECYWWRDEELESDLCKAVSREFNQTTVFHDRVMLSVYNDNPRDGVNTCRFLQVHVARDFTREEFERLRNILAEFDFNFIDYDWVAQCTSYMAERIDDDGFPSDY